MVVRIYDKTTICYHVVASAAVSSGDSSKSIGKIP
jgi:hypothetical protein